MSGHYAEESSVPPCLNVGPWDEGCDGCSFRRECVRSENW